jgi:hypothetical protein
MAFLKIAFGTLRVMLVDWRTRREGRMDFIYPTSRVREKEIRSKASSSRVYDYNCPTF